MLFLYTKNILAVLLSLQGIIRQTDTDLGDVNLYDTYGSRELHTETHSLIKAPRTLSKLEAVKYCKEHKRELFSIQENMNLSKVYDFFNITSSWTGFYSSMAYNKLVDLSGYFPVTLLDDGTAILLPDTSSMLPTEGISLTKRNDGFKYEVEVGNDFHDTLCTKKITFPARSIDISRLENIRKNIRYQLAEKMADIQKKYNLAQKILFTLPEFGTNGTDYSIPSIIGEDVQTKIVANDHFLRHALKNKMLAITDTVDLSELSYELKSFLRLIDTMLDDALAVLSHPILLVPNEDLTRIKPDIQYRLYRKSDTELVLHVRAKNRKSDTDKIDTDSTESIIKENDNDTWLDDGEVIVSNNQTGPPWWWYGWAAGEYFWLKAMDIFCLIFSFLMLIINLIFCCISCRKKIRKRKLGLVIPSPRGPVRPPRVRKVAKQPKQNPQVRQISVSTVGIVHPHGCEQDRTARKKKRRSSRTARNYSDVTLAVREGSAVRLLRGENIPYVYNSFIELNQESSL
jgi:hypothetical protein